MDGRRVIIDGPRSIVIEDFALPEKPAQDEILVRLHYSLISPGTELGGYVNARPGANICPGYTAVGEVLAVGRADSEELVGKMVYLFPELSDTRACHASLRMFKTSGLALPIPTDLRPDAACFARMVNIALTPYCNAAPKTGGAVLVQGLGLVGNTIGQVGRIRGFHTFGVDPDEARRTRAERVGFDVVLDPGDGDVAERVRALTDGRGVDLAVNATGYTAAFMDAIRATADGGEISTLGGARHPADLDAKRIFSEIHSRHLVVRGGWEMQLPLRGVPALQVASTEVNLQNAFRWLQSGAVRLDPVWTHTIPPERFQEAYDALLQNDPNYLGVIVDWR